MQLTNIVILDTEKGKLRKVTVIRPRVFVILAGIECSQMGTLGGLRLNLNGWSLAGCIGCCSALLLPNCEGLHFVRLYILKQVLVSNSGDDMNIKLKQHSLLSHNVSVHSYSV